MEEKRRNAYRYLLYQAMLDIRAYTPTGLGARILRGRVIQAAGAIANWMHNLAYYACSGFDGFDETLFWKEHIELEKRFSGTTITLYPERFQDFLDDFPNKGKIANLYTLPPNWPDLKK